MTRDTRNMTIAVVMIAIILAIVWVAFRFVHGMAPD
jgi:hypothetical protein